SVAWLKAMAWDLRGNMQDEIDRSLLTSRLDKGQIEDLYPEYPYKTHKPIVDRGAVSPVTGKFELDATPSGGTGAEIPQGAAEGLNTQLSALSDTLDEIPALLGPNGNGIGSNSWVVNGDHTTTGKALLA
ncbi:penicillin acylase family protein, partial [Streptomyces doebereineriae]